MIVEDRGVKFSLEEGDSDLEFELRTIQSTAADVWRSDEFQIWVLARDQRCLQQNKKLQTIGGIGRLGRVNQIYRAGFEKTPLTNVVAVVITIKGKLMSFDAHPERSDTKAVAVPEVVPGPKRNVTSQEPFPDGRYVAYLEWWGKKQTVTLQVKKNKAEVVESSDPKLDGMNGEFAAKGDGAFFIFFVTKDVGGASQHWTVQPDGSFIIKEVPDRGERQRAVLTRREF